MIAIDTNVLVHAVNSDDPAHDACRQFVSDALATRLVRVPWPVLFEFVRVVNHGVREIWTRDQDLHRFRDLTVRDPLTDRW